MLGFAWFVMAAAQLADIVSTNRVIRAGGHELNPVVAWIMSVWQGGWGVAKFAAANLIVWWVYGCPASSSLPAQAVARACVAQPNHISIPLILGLSVLFGYVARRNWGQVR